MADELATQNPPVVNSHNQISVVADLWQRLGDKNEECANLQAQYQKLEKAYQLVRKREREHLDECLQYRQWRWARILRIKLFGRRHLKRIKRKK